LALDKEIMGLANLSRQGNIDNNPAAKLFFDNIFTLLEKKPNNININKQDPDFKVTALHNAAGLGSSRLVEIILKYNPNPFLENCFGETPAQRARGYARNEALAAHLEKYQREYSNPNAAIPLPVASPANPVSMPVVSAQAVVSVDDEISKQLEQVELEQKAFMEAQEAALKANQRLAVSIAALKKLTQEQSKKNNPPAYAPAEPLPSYSQAAPDARI
jgi:hypothetical protein